MGAIFLVLVVGGFASFVTQTSAQITDLQVRISDVNGEVRAIKEKLDGMDKLNDERRDSREDDIREIRGDVAQMRDTMSTLAIRIERALPSSP